MIKSLYTTKDLDRSRCDIAVIITSSINGIEKEINNSSNNNNNRLGDNITYVKVTYKL